MIPTAPTSTQKIYLHGWPPFLFIKNIESDTSRCFFVIRKSNDKVLVYEADAKWQPLPDVVEKIFAGRLVFSPNQYMLESDKKNTIIINSSQAYARVNDAVKSMNRHWRFWVGYNALTFGWIGFLFWRKIQGVQLIFHIGGIFGNILFTLGSFKRYRDCSETFADTVIEYFNEARG
jgi:hypothetical protein